MYGRYRRQMNNQNFSIQLSPTKLSNPNSVSIKATDNSAENAFDYLFDSQNNSSQPPSSPVNSQQLSILSFTSVETETDSKITEKKVIDNPFGSLFNELDELPESKSKQSTFFSKSNDSDLPQHKKQKTGSSIKKQIDESISELNNRIIQLQSRIIEAPKLDNRTITESPQSPELQTATNQSIKHYGAARSFKASEKNLSDEESENEEDYFEPTSELEPHHKCQSSLDLRLAGQNNKVVIELNYFLQAEPSRELLIEFLTKLQNDSEYLTYVKSSQIPISILQNWIIIGQSDVVYCALFAALFIITKGQLSNGIGDHCSGILTTLFANTVKLNSLAKLGKTRIEKSLIQDWLEESSLESKDTRSLGLKMIYELHDILNLKGDILTQIIEIMLEIIKYKDMENLKMCLGLIEHWICSDDNEKFNEGRPLDLVKNVFQMISEYETLDGGIINTVLPLAIVISTNINLLPPEAIPIVYNLNMVDILLAIVDNSSVLSNTKVINEIDKQKGLFSLGFLFNIFQNEQLLSRITAVQTDKFFEGVQTLDLRSIKEETHKIHCLGYFALSSSILLLDGKNSQIKNKKSIVSKLIKIIVLFRSKIKDNEKMHAEIDNLLEKLNNV